jgi:hypothetical protein
MSRNPSFGWNSPTRLQGRLEHLCDERRWHRRETDFVLGWRSRGSDAAQIC